MLVKEYRVLMPLSVEEYRLAQLYMIQKKSRLESSGAGSGVEIIKNEPYKDGPGGKGGQYTYKIYHIGNRIPMWIRNVLPSNALEAHEQAWNAYPYTRTCYSCPLISHFRVEVDTRYLDDAGTTENIFELGPEELRNRIVDVLDFVRDPISSHDYCPEEDPKIYRSEKTHRGPLQDDWRDQFVHEGKPVMCAYKLCKVEFRYWGLQTRAERWIHELALRGTMLRAHRQAWVWQDEWVGLSMEDIRRLEGETQMYLTTLMSPGASDEAKNGSEDRIMANGAGGGGGSLEEEENDEDDDGGEPKVMAGSSSKSSFQSDLFFDCSDKLAPGCSPSHRPTLIRWSSELLINEDEGGGDSPPPSPPVVADKSPPVASSRDSPTRSLLILVFHGDLFPKVSADSKITDTSTFRSTMDTLIATHYPQLSSRVHVQNVKCGGELSQTAQMLNGLYPALGSFHPSFVPLLAADTGPFDEAVRSAILNANRAMHNFMASSDAGKQFGQQDGGEIFLVGDFIGGLLMYEALARTAARRESDRDREEGGERPAEEGQHRSPMCRVPASASPYIPSRASEDEHPSCSLQSLPSGTELPKFFNFDDHHKLAHKDHHTNHHNGGGHHSSDSPCPLDMAKSRSSAPPSACRQLSNSSDVSTSGNATSRRRSLRPVALSFRPSAAFLLGCPLALVLMQRKFAEIDQQQQLALWCDQLFNLYYALDLCATRLEPVLNPSLSLLSALKVPRYQRYPLGDGHDIHFDDSVVGLPMVWGTRRVDHELYCPPEMNSLPTMALPSILHASYWESKDLSAFILRQFLRSDELSRASVLALNSLISEQIPFQLQVPLASWNRRRTRFKVANLAANHQANDVIVVEGAEQVIHARFCYGPMDLVVLSYENVLVYVLPSGGEWHLRGVETTDKNGRLSIQLGRDLPIGMHNVRLIVQGDHTYLSVNIAVVPHGTPVVVFSIDGSLTASVSVTGRDPRLRPGAVDVVRFWQQQDYLIIYLTARPDMQQRLVSAWLATHNFPHGLLIFTPSLSTDPLRQKTQRMKQLIDMGIRIQAAYGSAKDIPVYANAGLEPERIFKVGGHRRRGCVSLEDGYCAHLHDLHSGDVPVAQPNYGAEGDTPAPERPQPQQPPRGPLEAQRSLGAAVGGGGGRQTPRGMMQRTLSFGPRTGRYSAKKISKVSTISTS